MLTLGVGGELHVVASASGNESARIFDDEKHSNDERREIIIGTRSNTIWLVHFTMRGTIVRLFSARRATKRERKDYEENVGL
jgi:uncharacterized DUF497 family protein